MSLMQVFSWLSTFIFIVFFRVSGWDIPGSILPERPTTVHALTLSFRDTLGNIHNRKQLLAIYFNLEVNENINNKMLNLSIIEFVVFPIKPGTC